MVALTLLIGICLDLITAAWFVVVALTLQWRLRGDSVMERAIRWSMIFWYGAAGFMVLDGGYAAFVLVGDTAPWVQMAVLLVRRLLFVVGTAFLVHLLWTMRTGDQRHLGALVAYYGVVAVLTEAVTLYQRPVGHEHLVWSIQFVTARATPLWLNVVMGAAIFVPMGLAAGGALRLYRQMPTRADRFRLAALCYSVISFVIGVLIGFVDNSWYWYGLFENRLIFAVAIGMWLVMYPFWIARRMGVPILTDLSQFPGVTRIRGNDGADADASAA